MLALKIATSTYAGRGAYLVVWGAPDLDASHFINTLLLLSINTHVVNIKKYPLSIC